MEDYSNYSFQIEGVEMRITMISYRKFRQILPMHCHGEHIYELHYVAGGKGEVVLDSKRYKLARGTLYVTGPNVFHEQISDQDDPVTEFGIYLRIVRGKPEGNLMSAFCETDAWVGRGRDVLRYLMQQILTEYEGKRRGWEAKISLLLPEFLIECVRSYESSSPHAMDLPRPGETFLAHDIRAENAQLVMDEIFLYEYKDIRLDALAKRLGFSIRQTQRFIQKFYGKSFSEKKREARMLAAVTMLTHTAMKITEISEQLGYSSIEHFSNAFSRYYGKSPREYRRQTKGRFYVNRSSDIK